MNFGKQKKKKNIEKINIKNWKYFQYACVSLIIPRDETNFTFAKRSYVNL